jgi:hypothetical protein
MNRRTEIKTTEILDLNQMDSGFLAEVKRRSGVDISLCQQHRHSSC